MDNNLKITKKRKMVIDVLKNSNEPLTSEEVYNKIGVENIDLSTVYRTLIFLYNASIVEKCLIDDGKAYYRLKDDKIHEHYLICSKCKKKVLLELCPINELESNIIKNTGFKITSHLLKFEGICQNCQNSLH